ncbi:hypothetical protein HMPREF1981_03129 [Bacteroides pyogenes F0041]|uniref:Uncharacterized protein n=1 Tax=Bacteroides pyogenes F0041 TaxID=1321819 RepID=U2BTJ1_9BACE|nr:hypothetical protein HMPREF1981_03129 [Bacteroides pyogenes F0041]GAE23295.1 hypothetical protein JCM10003_3029 [Bacteroides pyogenes JCM 10003]
MDLFPGIGHAGEYRRRQSGASPIFKFQTLVSVYSHPLYGILLLRNVYIRTPSF